MFLNIFCFQSVSASFVLLNTWEFSEVGQWSLLAAAMFSINYSIYQIGACD